MTKTWLELLYKVIKRDICTSCGACIAACPPDFIEMVRGKPKRAIKHAACENCEICYVVCPQTGFDTRDIESEFFGMKRRKDKDEHIGIYRRILTAKTKDKRIKGQDGGIVTSILTHALEEHIIDGAILTGSDSAWMPKPVVARSYEEVVGPSGTKYSISPTLVGVRDALRKGLENICIVGTCCHVRAARLMQFLNLEPLARSIKLVIGLFCYENFDYQGLMRGKIEDELGFKPEEISKFEVEGNEVLIHLKGKIFRVNLEDIEEYVHPSCAICPDFVNELADISVGSAVIIRSDTGEKIFSALENSGMI